MLKQDVVLTNSPTKFRRDCRGHANIPPHHIAIDATKIKQEYHLSVRQKHFVGRSNLNFAGMLVTTGQRTANKRNSSQHPPWVLAWRLRLDYAHSFHREAAVGHLQRNDVLAFRRFVHNLLASITTEPLASSSCACSK